MVDEWMEYAGMVRIQARRLRRTGFSTDELVTVGLWGLYQAAERFDPSRGVKFESFAQPRVRGEIIDWMDRNTSKTKPLTDDEILYDPHDDTAPVDNRDWAGRQVQRLRESGQTVAARMFELTLAGRMQREAADEIGEPYNSAVGKFSRGVRTIREMEKGPMRRRRG